MSATQFWAEVMHQNALGYMLNGDLNKAHHHALAGPSSLMIGRSSTWKDTTHLASEMDKSFLLGNGKRMFDSNSSNDTNSINKGYYVSEPSAKRFKSISSSPKAPIRATLLSDNPVLLERISNLGGFKWAVAAAAPPSQDKIQHPISDDSTSSLASTTRNSTTTRSLLPLSTKLGAFPMPAMSGEPRRRTSLLDQQPRLSSFRSLWDKTDPARRKDVLALKLEIGNVELL